MGPDIDIDQYYRDVTDLDRRSVQKNGLSFIFNITLQRKLIFTIVFFGYEDKMIKVTY